MTLVEAAVEGARVRFRPIMMTSFAFILGVVPLATCTGAGAGQQRSLGTAVFGGMLFASAIGIFFIPLLYVLAQGFQDWFRRKKKPHAPKEITPGPAVAEGDHREAVDGDIEVKKAELMQKAQSEASGMEALRKEAERIDAESREADRKEAERFRAQQEAQRKEAERLAAQQELQRKEAERIAAEREAQRREAERIAAEKEAQRREAERIAAEKEAQRREAERLAAQEQRRAAEKMDAERRNDNPGTKDDGKGGRP
jgi:hypothetical protein